MKSLLVWLARIIIYPAMAWLGLWVIFPAAGGGILGIFLASPTAAFAIFIDLRLTSWARGESLEKTVVKRVMFIDSIVSEKEVRGEIEAPDKKELPRGD